MEIDLLLEKKAKCMPWAILDPSLINTFYPLCYFFSGPLPYLTILMKGLSVRGFIVGRDCPQTRWVEAIAEMSKFIQEVKTLYNIDLREIYNINPLISFEKSKSVQFFLKFETSFFDFQTAFWRVAVTACSLKICTTTDY